METFSFQFQLVFYETYFGVIMFFRDLCKEMLIVALSSLNSAPLIMASNLSLEKESSKAPVAVHAVAGSSLPLSPLREAQGKELQPHSAPDRLESLPALFILRFNS